jgi:diguanylate cyclase (GGDEF)-like protein
MLTWQTRGANDMRTHGPSDTATSRSRPRSCRVSFVLLLVAIVPLLGVGSVTWTTVQDARNVSEAASKTEVLAQSAVDLTKLDGAVFDEMVWTAVDRFAASLGVAPEQVESFLGYNLGPQLEAAVGRTDQLLTATGDTAAADAITAARMTDLDIRGVLNTYREITASIQLSLDAVLGELESEAKDSSDNDELLQAAENLQLAIDTRGAIAEQFYGYFATLFDFGDTPSVELGRLMVHRAAYQTILAELRVAAGDTPELLVGLDRIESDSGLAKFGVAVDDLIAKSVATGVPATAPPISVDSVVANLDGFTTIFLTAIGAPDTTSTLLDTAVDGVLSETREVKTDADANISRAYALTLALTTTTLLTAWLAARFIVRPLRRLQRSARGLRDNGDLTPLVSVGPTEVRAAEVAIHHAATHLDLVTRQARALATGDLDAAVLDEPAPGGLGSAVQNAVGTLRTALAQQEEFRRRLAHEAAHDGLTKLPNRNASMAQLTRSLARTTRSNSKLAVLFIDLDMFKDVNDQHGHHAGDAVLTTVAQRLVNSVREGDHVGRLGGDEFVVVAEPVTGVDETVALAERILETLAEPIDLPNLRVKIGASIGIALADGADLTADELLRDADLAVYRAKATGRGGIEICDEDLRNELAEAADLSLAIRVAIDHDELVMYYQPIVDTRTTTSFHPTSSWRSRNAAI